MDVTPQLIEQIDFAEKFRGYDPDQVDDFLERVGATLAELTKTSREAVERAERAEADLRNAPAASQAPLAAMSDEEEAMQATRTLMMAKRTADAAIADARQEAQKLVADAQAAVDQQRREAQTEADRVVGEARVNADQMSQKAAAEANREYGARRDQALAEIGDLESRKVGIAGQLVALESRLEEYRGGLSSIHRSVGAILDDPDASLRAPLPGIDLADLARPAAPSSVPAPTAPQAAEPFRSAPTPAPVDPSMTGETGTPASVAATPAFAESPFAEPTAPATSAGGEVNGYHNGSPEGQLDETARRGPDNLTQPHAAEPTTELAGAGDLPWSDDAADDQAVGADPWGPGSWGEVASFPDPADAFGADPGNADRSTTGSHAFSEFPSEGLPVIGQDRYTRDLDEAVNQPAEAHDDAMSAFFEGDDAQQPRRFGRRR